MVNEKVNSSLEPSPQTKNTIKVVNNNKPKYPKVLYTPPKISIIDITTKPLSVSLETNRNEKKNQETVKQEIVNQDTPRRETQKRISVQESQIQESLKKKKIILINLPLELSFLNLIILIYMYLE